MYDTNGQIADGRKRLEPEWIRARQPMYEPRPVRYTPLPPPPVHPPPPTD